jgi:hypothetical protein
MENTSPTFSFISLLSLPKDFDFKNALSFKNIALEVSLSSKKFAL